MDENSTIERRYSFNVAQTSPVAESTQLGSSFSWGSSPSMRPRSNSSLCLNHTSSAKYKNVTKIDARIAADVQSKGLASRIVKYHESGARLNRSSSARNLYSRPGQFPTVTLKKTELPYRAKKQELSMIRIPLPEKSTFYGNTISSLLKSNSVVGLKSKRTEDNRPIMHPPPSENDMAPTRSVLEVLKEISRKRINSDDLVTDETSKKYCSRGVGDFIDAGTCAATTTIVTNIEPTSHRFKRQRDSINPNQSVHLTESKSSPEQAKKRICNYNNDITSSLSSSVKKRSNEKSIASYSLNQTMFSNLESYETQTTRGQQCCFDHQHNNDQTDIRLKSLANNPHKSESVKPITSMPTTACVLNEGKSSIAGPRTVSDSFNSSNGKATSKIQSVGKPLLTLFNKKYEVEVEKNTLGKADDLNNSDEYVGIPFVKPKKMSFSGLKNPVIERTQKSKLALMLSGLRGELYQNSDKNYVDLSKEKQENVEDKKLNVIENTLLSASKSVSAVTSTLTTVTSSCNANSTTGALTNSGTADFNTNAITDVVRTNTSSPLVGLKLTQIKSSSANNTASSANDTNPAAIHSKANVPVLGGFSLNVPNTNILATSFTTVTSKSPINPILSVSKASSLVKSSEPASNISISLNLPTTKDSAISFPLVSVNSKSNAITSLLPNISLSTTNPTKPTNTFAFGSNGTSITTTTNTSKNVENGSLSFSAAKLNSSFNSSIPTQTLTSSLTPKIFGSLETSTTASVILSNIASTVTSLTPTITTFSLTQSITSTSVAVTKTPTGNSSTRNLSFSSQPTTTTVSTFNASNDTGKSVQSTNTVFSFGSLSNVKSTASEDKNNPNHILECNKPFTAPPSTFFGASNQKGSVSAPLFESSTIKTEKNVFGTSNVFGSNSIKNDSRIFGSSSDKSTPFSGSNANNSTPTPFSFGTKLSVPQPDNNSNTSGGFPFASSISRSTEGGAFGFGNTITTKSPIHVFGTVSSTAPENKAFTFGTSNKTENTTGSQGGFSFSSTTAQKPTTFSFCSTGNSTAGFSFAGVSSPFPAETTSVNKPFSFGTSQSQATLISISESNPASSNIFGSATPKAVQQPSFNFNSGNSSNLQQSGQPINNIFASPVSSTTTGTENRVIRRATRRLQK